MGWLKKTFGGSSGLGIGSSVKKEVSRATSDVLDELDRHVDKLESLIDGVEEYFKVITGEYHRDAAKVQKAVEDYENAVKDYESYVDTETNTSIFNDEVLNIASSNRIDKATEALQAIQARVEQLVKEFENEYSAVNDMASSKIGGLLLFVPMVIGGLVSDLRNIADGDMDALKRIFNTTLQVLGIVATLLAAYLAMFIPGGQGVAVALVVAAIAQMTSLVITLDSMYNQGLLMGSMFGYLDMVLNDVFNFDKWAGSDFGKLGDTEYYQELTGYVQMTATIVSMAAMVTGYVSNPAAFTEAMSASSKGLMESASINLGPLSSLMSRISDAMAIGDLVEARQANKDLQEELEKEKEKIAKEQRALEKRKIQQSYAEQEDIQKSIDAVDVPYVFSDASLIIKANYGYRSEGDEIEDTQKFGFEDVLELANAGSDEYYDSIIYGT